MRSILRDMQKLAGFPVREEKDIVASLRDLLREIVTNAKTHFKNTSPDDLADKLEELLKQANLVKPPALSKKQYQAVAEVWEALGDDVGSAQQLAGRAIMQLSETDTSGPHEPVLTETDLVAAARGLMEAGKHLRRLAR